MSRFNGTDRLLPCPLKRVPTPRQPEISNLPAAVGVVEIHQAGLRVNAGGSQASRMVRIPLYLGGSPRMTFDDHAFGDPVDWRCCGVILRPTRNHVLRRIHIGHDGLFRLPGGWEEVPVSIQVL